METSDMVGAFRSLVLNQMEAALCTLDACVGRCPEGLWTAAMDGEVFCQLAFHAAFYADYYLGRDGDSFRDQDFHRDHASVFRDYEELEDRAPVLLYERGFVRAYIGHCRWRTGPALAAETGESLAGPTGFGRLSSCHTRAELYINNIRHVQHHAAQLSLKLASAGLGFVPWVGSGWREAASG